MDMDKDKLTMNEPWLEGKWKEIKGKLREEWGELTDDDLDRAAGKRDQLIGVIQQRYGKARAEVEEQLAAWERRQGCTDEQLRRDDS